MADKTPDDNEAILRRLDSLRGDDVPHIPDFPDTDPSSQSGSNAFFQEEASAEDQTQRTGRMSGVSVESGEGADGLEGMSTKDLLRELIRVARTQPQELNDLLRQD